MSAIAITSDTESKLLERREVVFAFKNGNGLLTRQSAAEAVANSLGVAKETVQVVSLKGRSGVRDLTGVFYVFQTQAESKKQIPKYVAIRMLPTKNERKKAREDLKKAKVAAPAAAAPAQA